MLLNKEADRTLWHYINMALY